MRRFGPLVIVAALGLTSPAALRAQNELDQTTRLAALCRVWGLLKYFHPDVTGGRVDWDAALIETIPRVQSAGTRTALNEELLRLIRSAGPEPRLPAGRSVDQPETDPLFAWLGDRAIFEPSSMQALKAIRLATVPLASRYVRRAPAGNPDFSGEAVWQGGAFPNEENRLLALFRFWNMVQYYFPNRDIMDRPWNDVLVEFIPPFVGAADALAYHLTASELVANIDDSHGAFNSPTITTYWGSHLPGIRTRFIESQTVVTRVYPRYLGSADVRVGDVITTVGGVPAADVRSRVARYIAGSNRGALQRTVDSLMLRTNGSTLSLGLSRSGTPRSATLQTYAASVIFGEETALVSKQPKWQVLNGNIGYVNMGILLITDVPAMIAALGETRAIVFDVRNYPNGTLYLIAQWLNPAARDFVTFTAPDYERPGSFAWTTMLRAGPAAPRPDAYRGRVLVLGDERTQSHAEFTMMALKTAPDVIVLGSPTAGADGNVSQIDLPGGIRTFFSGLGVFYPDRSPTQRVGIVPDIHVTPTIVGIQNGVDEVLQRSLALVP
jgi:C-terminal processing protease CtpA/Prc